MVNLEITLGKCGCPNELEPRSPNFGVHTCEKKGSSTIEVSETLGKLTIITSRGLDSLFVSISQKTDRKEV